MRFSKAVLQKIAGGIMLVIIITYLAFHALGLFQYKAALGSFMQAFSTSKSEPDYSCPAVQGDVSDKARPHFSLNRDLDARMISSFGKNLITNADFSQKIKGGQATKIVGFTPASYGVEARYSVMSDDSNYLSAELTATKEAGGDAKWAPDRIASSQLLSPRAIIYRDAYRSKSESYLILETTDSSGKSSFTEIARLAPSEQWRDYAIQYIVPSSAKSFRIFHSLFAVGRLDIKNISLQSLTGADLRSPIISVSFDDGWQSVYQNALPILDKYSVRTTQYIIADEISKPEYMTEAELKKLMKDGHEIGGHSLRHCDLTTLAGYDLRYDIQNSKKILSKTFGPIKGFAHPFGSYNDSTVEELKKEFSYIRSTDVGFNTRFFDKQNIQVQNIYPDTKLSEVEAMVSQAVNEKLWLVFVYHRAEPTGKYGINLEELDKQIATIAKSGAKVLPISAAIEEINSQ